MRHLEIRVAMEKIAVRTVSLTSGPKLLFQDLVHTVDVTLVHSENTKIVFLSIK